MEELTMTVCCSWWWWWWWWQQRRRGEGRRGDATRSACGGTELAGLHMRYGDGRGRIVFWRWRGLGRMNGGCRGMEKMGVALKVDADVWRWTERTTMELTNGEEEEHREKERKEEEVKPVAAAAVEEENGRDR